MQKIKNLSQVNTNTDDGKYLIAALAKLTENIPGDKSVIESVDVMLENLTGMVEKTYKHEVWEDPKPAKPTKFIEDLRRIINQHSIENESNSPDYVLAMFLTTVLAAYASAVQERDKFFGFNPWDKNA